MRSNSVLAALAVVACVAAAVAKIFHGHKPLADIAFAVFAVAAVTVIAAVLYRALRSRRTTATLTLVVACSLAASASATTTLPKASWIAKADATCKRIDARVAAIPQPNVNPASPRQADLPAIARYLSRLHPLLAREIAAVSALPAPSSDATLAHSFVVSAHASVTALGQSAKAAARGDLTAYKQSFLRDNRAGTRASAIAKRLSLNICGR